MALVLWAAVAVYCLISLTYAVLLLRQALRQAARGHRLDTIVLWLRVLRRRRVHARVEQLERRIVWRVLAAGVRDPTRRVIWLPDTVEVLVAPDDLRVSGLAFERMHDRALARLEALARTRRCRFRARPAILVTGEPTCPPGRAALRLAFGEATERTATSAGNGQPLSSSRSRRPWHGARLRPVHPPGIPLDLPRNHRFTIGRLPSSELTVDQPTVSRQHAVMFQHDGVWYVADSNSTNGTFVNRIPIAGAVRLADSDEIRLGASVRLRFELRSIDLQRRDG